MRLSQIIVESAESAIELQQKNGSFPPGHNGPYFDDETPVRNTAHWLITFLKAYEISSNARFTAAAHRAAEYLISLEARPMKASFFCRTNPEKDFCNGLIGQAWVIEALAAAGEAFDCPKYQDLAEEVFLLHPFIEKTALWRRVSVDGSFLSLDFTFNHQLWFAMAGGLLINGKNAEIEERVALFLGQTSKNHLKTATNGRIIHNIESDTGKIKKLLRLSIHPLANLQRRHQAVTKAIGYHAFNLYAFGKLHRIFPDHSLWNSRKFHSILNYLGSPEFLNGISNNAYGYPYNPPGFEVSFAIQEFNPNLPPKSHNEAWWVSEQLKRTYDSTAKMMKRNTQDPSTASARLYEACCLNDVELNNDL